MNRDSNYHRVGDWSAEVKYRVDSVRSVRMAMINLAYALAHEPGRRGYLLLVDAKITERRLREEWQNSESVLRGEILHRVTICLAHHGQYSGIPHDPPRELWPLFDEFLREASGGALRPSGKTDYAFVVQKVLLHHWLLSGEPVTAEWLARAAGCSYLTVSRVIKRLGSLVERTSDRRITLRFFPREQFARLIAIQEKARSTVRFADRSGQPRALDANLGRLHRMNLAHVAVGGVPAAKHYLPELDLVGTPRLDVSVHCHERPFDLAFVRELDPALKREDDPLRPAHLAVHAVRHADPLFTAREGGLWWADPLECLFDLNEAHLDLQAEQLLDALKKKVLSPHAG